MFDRRDLLLVGTSVLATAMPTLAQDTRRAYAPHLLDLTLKYAMGLRRRIAHFDNGAGANVDRRARIPYV
jgi:hypothetical protein